MRKSRGNVVSAGRAGRSATAPTRSALFLMFIGPWDQGGPWSPTGIDGVDRWLNRVWGPRLPTWTARCRTRGQMLEAPRS